MRVASKVARATLLQVLGKSLGAAIGLLVLGIASRNLQGDGFGYYATILAYVALASVVSDLGLGQLAGRELAVGEGNLASRFGHLLGLRIAASISILGVCAIGAQLLPLSNAVKSGVWAGSCAFALAAISQVFVALYQVRISMGLPAAAELVGRLVLLGVVFVSVRVGWGLQGVLVAHVAANATTLAVLAFSVSRFAPIRPRIDRERWRGLVVESWPIALSGVLLFFYSKADILILSALKPADTVGLYAAAYKLIEVVVQLPVMFAGFVVPLLTFASADPARARAIFQRAFDILSLFTIGMVTGGVMLADPIIRFVNGDAFAPAAGYFRILILAAGLLSLSTLPSFAVVAIKKQRAMVPLYLAVAGLGVLLYATLIPALSGQGAAIGTLVTELVFAVAAYSLALRWMRFGLRLGVAGRGLVAAVVLSVLLAVTQQWHLLVRVAVGGGVYLATLLLLRAVDASMIADVFSGGGAGRESSGA